MKFSVAPSARSRQRRNYAKPRYQAGGPVMPGLTPMPVTAWGAEGSQYDPGGKARAGYVWNKDEAKWSLAPIPPLPQPPPPTEIPE